VNNENQATETPAQTMELVVVQTAITKMDRVSEGLKDLSTRFAGVVFDVTTPKGMAEAKAARKEIAGPRIEVERIRKEAKAPILELGRKLDAEAKRITGELEKIEGPIDRQIVGEENRIEAERQAAIKAEQDRVANHLKRLDAIRDRVRLGAQAKSAAQVSELMNEVDSLVIDATWQEYADAAADAKAEAFTQLDKMLEAAVAREKEDQRLREERAELDKRRAEQEARDKVERERAAAETAAANKKLADERAAFEAEQAAERARVAAENARIAAEQAAAQKVIDDQRAEIEARQRQEREAREEAQRKEAADAMERERLNFKPTAESIVQVLCTTYGRDADTVTGWLREYFGSKARKAA
jgi:hypothetical protein